MGNLVLVHYEYVLGVLVFAYAGIDLIPIGANRTTNIPIVKGHLACPASTLGVLCVALGTLGVLDGNWQPLEAKVLLLKVACLTLGVRGVFDAYLGHRTRCSRATARGPIYRAVGSSLRLGFRRRLLLNLHSGLFLGTMSRLCRRDLASCSWPCCAGTYGSPSARKTFTFYGLFQRKRTGPGVNHRDSADAVVIGFQAVFVPYLVDSHLSHAELDLVDLRLLKKIDFWPGKEHKFYIVKAEPILDHPIHNVVFPPTHKRIKPLFLRGLLRILGGAPVHLFNKRCRRYRKSKANKTSKKFVTLGPKRLDRSVLNIKWLHASWDEADFGLKT